MIMSEIFILPKFGSSEVNDSLWHFEKPTLAFESLRQKLPHNFLSNAKVSLISRSERIESGMVG